MQKSDRETGPRPRFNNYKGSMEGNGKLPAPQF